MAPKNLNRSKSLRLRSSQKRLGQDGEPLAYSNAPLNGKHVALPGSADKHAQPTSDPTRPSTAGGTMHRSRGAGFAATQPSYFGDDEEAKYHQPSSPAVLWAAEVHADKSLPSPIRSPGKAVTSDFAQPSPASWRLEDARPSNPVGDPHIEQTAETMEGKPKISRWRSFRSIFGKKSPQYNQSSQLTPPFGDYSGLQNPEMGPTRATSSPRATRSDEQNATVSRTPPVPAKTWQDTQPQVYQPTGTYIQPTNHTRNLGFQGGHKYQAGTTTRPQIDVEIPDVHMERYSVMFGGLLRSNTQPSLHSRRQGMASRINPLPTDTIKLRGVPELNKPQPPTPQPTTPRSAARYQLSLFPPASPRSQQHLNPLGMHKPRTLQRSQTSPTPRSPSALSFQPSISSNTMSEEVPVRLDIAPEDAPHVAPPQALTFQVNKVHDASQTEVMILTPTPSTGRFSFHDGEAPDSDVNGSSKPDVPEPAWEMVTPSQSNNRSPNQTTAAMNLSDQTAVEQPVQVSVARSMSLKRAKSTKRYYEPKTGLSVPSPGERLVDRKPLTPTLVELKNRKSHTVQIEGF